MGRKSQSKHGSKKNSSKETNKFSQQKRKELAILVNKLLKLTSTFQASINISKSWEHHLEIEAILKDITNIEFSNNTKSIPNSRHLNIEKFIAWLTEHGAQFDGLEINEFEGYDLGLKATKDFIDGSLILTVPRKLMMTEQDARENDLATFIAVDPLLQNMPNITLALYLLLEKNNPESFWKPYLDILPQKNSTVLYFTSEELSELRPSPVFESSLKLFKSIARQYAYFYNKIHTLDLPVLLKFQDIFTFDNYRWAVSTVMTRQNNLQICDADTKAFIPLWDMCNHEHGKITSDFNKELNRGECYALRDFKSGEQIFIFYGARPNADLFLHNGFVYPNNQHDSLSLALGVSSGDPLHDTKMSILNKLGLAAVTHYNLYRSETPISPELLAFIRIFNMNQEELTHWSNAGMPSELVSSDRTSADLVGQNIDQKAYSYLLTRCKLVRASYKKDGENKPDTVHRKNIRLLKECEVQILDDAIKYLESVVEKLSSEIKSE